MEFLSEGNYAQQGEIRAKHQAARLETNGERNDLVFTTHEPSSLPQILESSVFSKDLLLRVMCRMKERMNRRRFQVRRHNSAKQATKRPTHELELLTLVNFARQTHISHHSLYSHFSSVIPFNTRIIVNERRTGYYHHGKECFCFWRASQNGATTDFVTLVLLYH